MNSGLIIEGGGLRGFFSAGILSVLAKENIEFPYLIGISSGALVALAYEFKMDLSFLNTEKYFNKKNQNYWQLQNFFRIHRGLLDTNRFFRAMPEIFENLQGKNLKNHMITSTHAKNAMLKYWDLSEVKSGKELEEKVRASCSIPVVMPDAYVEDELYVDGGIMDSIPIKKLLADGIKKPVIILTRELSYVKGQQIMLPHLNMWLRGLPELKSAMKTRHLRYNESLEIVRELELAGKAFVFRPKLHRIDRFELNKKKAKLAFQDGVELGKSRLEELKAFLES